MAGRISLPAGANEARGATGNTGAKGYTGASGDTGASGRTGAIGATAGDTVVIVPVRLGWRTQAVISGTAR